LTLAITAALACAVPPALAQAQDAQDTQKIQNTPGGQNTQDTQKTPGAQNTQNTQNSENTQNTENTKVDAQRSPPNRYTFNRVDNGFLRLDNNSGQIAFCSPHSVGWACEAVPEDRAALEKEIARLQDEVASLKTAIAALRAPPPLPVPPETVPPTPHAGKDGDAQIKLPTQEDIDRARAFIEDTWRRLMEMIVNIQKDMMRKG
jgi:hypothetical protein